MNNLDLKEVMKFHLRNFAPKGKKVYDTTIHNEILSNTDGFRRPSSSATIYKSLIKWTLNHAGNQNIKWPRNWITLSVADLSDKLITN